MYIEICRKFGFGVELDCVLFVGGGSVVFVSDIVDWFFN